MIKHPKLSRDPRKVSKWTLWVCEDLFKRKEKPRAIALRQEQARPGLAPSGNWGAEPVTRPHSSLKGRMRTLLSTLSDKGSHCRDLSRVTDSAFIMLITDLFGYN